MRVIVIGAGVGGTSAALALQKLGHDVVVYDRMRENRPVGAALSLWSNGVKVLNWLGLGPQVAALGGQMDDMAYYDGHTGDELCRFSLAPVTTQTGQRPYPVARADLQQLMMDAVGPANIRLGRQLVGVSDDGETVTATFADGTTDTADLLIGADGARSIVRDYVTEPTGIRPERSYSGYVNYNGLVAADERIGPLDQWTTYVGDGKRCAVMPVAGDRFYFFVDVPGPSGVVEDRMSALEAAFGSWGAPGVRALLDGIDADESLNRVEIWDIDPFDTWVRGRVAILGDAAHNTAPDIGQGACSALEDSFALGIVFATSTLGVEDALKRYERIRTERAGDLVLRARRRAHETHAFDIDATQAWYDGLRREDGTGVIRGIVGNIEGSPVELGASVLG
ncbi:FAD-dependent urate hydroxylase HpxO [Microbacterium sp. CFBP 8790]|uniref:FAD-dependent urate hydroxylase HpxO n=1 Tax=unclassified Microbacterium TaxID=2609290 RepID=UPI0017819C42|nr:MULTISPECIES: FAD-dependent urate hydroxylase HpxO [unclassified Microbacterium]MBD8207017.1 FAD-dependent urate hydroxylase HpxO [Microbacterium sp. CFBP 8801]MBD8508875.1 FAD-dependent urate hydroxylase HpxO [Microbacterium sp. CFBP 8790]